jgi:hypothetical protein
LRVDFAVFIVDTQVNLPVYPRGDLYFIVTATHKIGRSTLRRWRREIAMSVLKQATVVALLIGMSSLVSAEQKHGVDVDGLLVDKQIKFNEAGDLIPDGLNDSDVAAVRKCERSYADQGRSYSENSFVQECLNQTGHPRIIVLGRITADAQPVAVGHSQLTANMAGRKELARHLMLFKYPGLAHGNVEPRKPIDAAEMLAANECKDAVADGQKFPQSDREEPPLAPPGMIDPTLEQAALMVNRCLARKGVDGLFVVGSELAIERPLLK